MVLQHLQREGEMRQKQKDPNMIGPFSCLLQVPSDALNNGDGAGVSLMSLRLGFCRKILAILSAFFSSWEKITQSRAEQFCKTNSWIIKLTKQQKTEWSFTKMFSFSHERISERIVRQNSIPTPDSALTKLRPSEHVHCTVSANWRG